ncbi:hypothetical protein [Aliikangiella sp. IMCC44632]
MNWHAQWIRNKRWLQVILISAVFALSVRLLIKFELDSSALLYLAIPYLIALTLAFFRRREHTGSIPRKYARLCIDSLIVMLASSLILFEGFICVLMFMPIYFAVVLLAFAIESLTYHYSKKSGKNKLKVHLLPYLFLIFSIEGVSPELSFPRENAVSVTRTVLKTPEQIHQSLQKPMSLEVSRHWFLSIFPMPYQIDAESLSPGDIHSIDYRYHRWFFTNTHEGRLSLLIEQVELERVKTKILEDTSYLSNYMELKGTEIRLKPNTDGSTEVTLSVFYERKLDPAWYFQPLQEYGVTKMAEFLIYQLMQKG